MNVVHSINQPTLASAERAFADWRAHREARGHTPQPLRRQAVALLEHHCAFQVCRALGLHADALKRWAREYAADMPSNNPLGTVVADDDFVALPDTAHAAQYAGGDTSGHTVIVERADGLRLTIIGALSMADLIGAMADAGASR